MFNPYYLKLSLHACMHAYNKYNIYNARMHTCMLTV